MNPILIAVSAVLVALIGCGAAGLFAWLWLHSRGTNRRLLADNVLLNAEIEAAVDFLAADVAGLPTFSPDQEN